MTRGSDPGPGAGGAHPTLAQQAGTAVSAAARRLACTTGAPVVRPRPWPDASFTQEQPGPGAGIRIALALERAARAGVRVFIARARGAGMSWHQAGEALGVAGLARARGSSLGEAAWEYAAERPAHLSGQPGEFRWVCPDCGEVVSGRRPGRAQPGRGRARACRGLPAARGRRSRVARPGRLTHTCSHHAAPKTFQTRPAVVNLCHDHLTCLPCSRLSLLSSHTMITCTLPPFSSPLILLAAQKPCT